MNMAYQVIEFFTASKTGDPNTNEDAFLISDAYIAVIDGTTSKKPTSHDKKTGGRIARDIIYTTLQSLHGDEECNEVITKIQQSLLSNAPEAIFGSISASAVVFSIKRQEIWSIGDCQIMINGELKSKGKPIDSLLAEMRSFVLHAFIRRGVSAEELMEHDIGREMILPFLKLQQQFENKTGKYGYGVFNNTTTDTEDLLKLVQVITVPMGAQVILASDGYPVLKESLAESERALQYALEVDPLCFKEYPSTKGLTFQNQSFDDRTYLKFQLV